MGPKKAKATLYPVITLGVPEQDELDPSSPLLSVPEQTPLTDNETDPFEEGTQKRAPQIRWTLEMEEALMEYLHKVSGYFEAVRGDIPGQASQYSEGYSLASQLALL